MPSVTKLVARQAYIIESRTFQPLTRPVAFLRKSVGVSPRASAAMYYSASRLWFGQRPPAAEIRPTRPTAPHADQPQLVRNVTLRILCHFPKPLSVVLCKSFCNITGRCGAVAATLPSSYPFTSRYLLTL